jgi:hypothetical protein
MCRSKELGGRRCPSLVDPTHRSEVNRVRREKYATAKNVNKPTEVSPYAEQLKLFPPINEMKKHFKKNPELLKQHDKEAVAFSKKIDKNFNLTKWRDELENSSSDEEELGPARAALLSYANYGYRNIRNYLHGHNIQLRKQHNLDAEELQAAKEQIAIIDETLAKAVPPAEPRTLFRGMNIPSKYDTESWLSENFPVGGVVSQKSYMSTSMSAAPAVGFTAQYDDSDAERKRAVVMEFVTKQGAPLGRGTSYFESDELEVLIPRDAKFRVVEVQQEVVYPYEADVDLPMSFHKTVIRLIDVTDEDES